MSSVPDWNGSGLLPFFVGPDVHSPYEMSAADTVKRFGYSQKRRDILNRWLQYRQLLYPYFEYGVQWINGSFVKRSEVSRGNDPRDIDLVDIVMERSGFAMPFGLHRQIGDMLGLDNYLLTLPSLEVQAAQTAGELFRGFSFFVQRLAYWHLWWGHTREGASKGFISVPLSAESDKQALELLESMEVSDD